MPKTIHKLWYGDVDPFYLAGRGRADVQRLEDLMRRNLEKVDGYLQKEAKEWMEKYRHCADEHETLLAEQAFLNGFSLGVKIITEAMTHEE